VKKREHHQTTIERCREWAVSHQAGPMYWLRNVTKTENYHWKEQGVLGLGPVHVRLAILLPPRSEFRCSLH